MDQNFLMIFLMNWRIFQVLKIMTEFNSVMIFKTRILEFYRSQAFYLLLKLVTVFRLFSFFFWLILYLCSALVY